jgi:hypothetical protein
VSRGVPDERGSSCRISTFISITALVLWQSRPTSVPAGSIRPAVQHRCAAQLLPAGEDGIGTGREELTRRVDGA